MASELPDSIASILSVNRIIGEEVMDTQEEKICPMMSRPVVGFATRYHDGDMYMSGRPTTHFVMCQKGKCQLWIGIKEEDGGDYGCCGLKR